MGEKNKQIIEMKEHLDKCCSDSSVATCIDYNCNGCRATYLYNQGYRKTEKGTVVLTSEEYISLLNIAYLSKDKVYDQARKETAREILQIIKEKAWAYNEDEDGKAWNWEITQTELDEIEKKYGVNKDNKDDGNE